MDKHTHFQRELETLKENLLRMATLVEANYYRAEKT